MTTTLDNRPYGLTGPRCAWDKAVAYSATDPRYRAILERCAQVGWPIGFQSDVAQHDLDFCRANPGAEFVFVLRDHGSHCYVIGDDCKGARDWARRVCYYHSGESPMNYHGPEDERPKFFHVTAQGSQPITWQEAQQLVSRIPDNGGAI